MSPTAGSRSGLRSSNPRAQPKFTQEPPLGDWPSPLSPFTTFGPNFSTVIQHMLIHPSRHVSPACVFRHKGEVHAKVPRIVHVLN